MRWWLASAGDQVRHRPLKRFDPRYWLVDFPRPMMASVTTVGPETVAVDLVFHRRADLAGLIWESEDRWSHPLLGYATRRDYRGLTFRFRWQSSGIQPLDAVNGPVLTIEGRDAAGTPRIWYVRLWNYAEGGPEDAVISLDFDALAGGFLLPGEADPVWAGDIDRLFISLVPPGHDGMDAPLPEPVTAHVEMTMLSVDGAGAVLQAGDAFVPPHDLRLCTAYDDSYNQTPERLLEQAEALGYRGPLVHYVGMSHFMALRWDGARHVVDEAEPLCGPARAWHADYLARAREHGFAPILSLSMELFDAHCPAAWAQRNSAGARGLTGWVPPSALLSPARADAMVWLRSVGVAFIQLALAAGVAPAFQIGEPWWWVGPDQRPCFYDAATVARFTAERGAPPPVIADIRSVSTAAERDFLDWLGALLGEATLGLRDAVVAAAPGCETLLLFYAPQVLNAAAPELIRANMPLAWGRPAFDVLQLEDYTFVTGADAFGQARGRAAVAERLGYPLAQQHYFSGFVLLPERAAVEWPLVAEAAAASLARGVETFVWAWPQVARDGFTSFRISGEEQVTAFHDVRFPLDLGYGATGGPAFSTQVVVTGSGREQRNSEWADARANYDAGVGVRSEADLAALIAFFRARRGQAHGFRFNDPLDNRGVDQRLGTGDGRTTGFALVRHYGDPAQTRRITRPVPGSVVVRIDGTVASGWAAGPLGQVDFAVAPPPGAAITASFDFDVPVRFATDRLDVSIAGWRAGELPSVPLVEIRED